eukprot:TRINITY_DN13224_c0_g1_i1.p1 TRINITY_DN13224_c0_g1~~TRINITY_DN13224_c0_g1_i1.p1  ORF type:complete len:257 (-),score=68.76 TRINITY_DN13224_c0_g1_i1:128-898(-)
MQAYPSKVLVHEEDDFIAHKRGADSDDDDDIQFAMDSEITSVSNSYECPSPSVDIMPGRMGRYARQPGSDEEDEEEEEGQRAGGQRSDMPFAYEPLSRKKSMPEGVSVLSSSIRQPRGLNPVHSDKNVTFADSSQSSAIAPSSSHTDNVLSSSMRQYNAIKMKYMQTLNIPVPSADPNADTSPSIGRRNRTISAPVASLAKSMPLAVPSNQSENRDWKMARSVYGDQFIPPHEMVKHDTFSVWQNEQRKQAANKAV